MRVHSPVNYICFKSNTTFTKFTGGYELEFLPSPTHNRLTVTGCNTLGLISYQWLERHRKQLSGWLLLIL